MPISEDLISIIGLNFDSVGVSGVVAECGLTDVFDEIPFRKYVGSSNRGVYILIENEQVVAVQFFVQGDDSHLPFRELLPYKLKAGMTDDDVHNLLGQPDIRDVVGSKYGNINEKSKLIVAYDDDGFLEELSVELI